MVGRGGDIRDGNLGLSWPTRAPRGCGISYDKWRNARANRRTDEKVFVSNNSSAAATCVMGEACARPCSIFRSSPYQRRRCHAHSEIDNGKREALKRGQDCDDRFAVTTKATPTTTLDVSLVVTITVPFLRRTSFSPISNPLRVHRPTGASSIACSYTVKRKIEVGSTFT